MPNCVHGDAVKSSVWLAAEMRDLLRFLRRFDKRWAAFCVGMLRFAFRDLVCARVIHGGELTPRRTLRGREPCSVWTRLEPFKSDEAAATSARILSDFGLCDEGLEHDTASMEI